MSKPEQRNPERLPVGGRFAWKNRSRRRLRSARTSWVSIYRV